MTATIIIVSDDGHNKVDSLVNKIRGLSLKFNPQIHLKLKIYCLITLNKLLLKLNETSLQSHIIYHHIELQLGMLNIKIERIK